MAFPYIFMPERNRGFLDGIDIIDAIKFDDTETRRRKYFDHADLVAFPNSIGR
jgi:hypothetical protein